MVVDHSSFSAERYFLGSGLFWIQSARKGRLEVGGKNLGHRSYDVSLVMFVAVRIGVSLESNYEEATLLKILYQ